MAEHKDIHAAINAVMQVVSYVQKDKSVGTGNYGYKYAGEAALIEALRPPMVENGIYCAVVDVKDVYRDEVATSNRMTQRTALIATVRFTHAPSGTSIDVMATGEGSDTLDKSSNKAMTGAYKYALRQTFCIETGDDPDDTLSPQQGVERSNTPPPATATQQRPPAAPQDNWRTTLRESLGELNLTYAHLEPVLGEKPSADNLERLVKAYLAKPDHSIVGLVEDTKAAAMSQGALLNG